MGSTDARDTAGRSRRFGPLAVCLLVGSLVVACAPSPPPSEAPGSRSPKPQAPVRSQNARVANRLGVDATQGGLGGLDPLRGDGVLVGDWDEEHARASHLALAGRVVARDAAGENEHATHTTATLLGGDAPDPETRGMAPGARAWLYDWQVGLAELREVTHLLAVTSHPFADQAGWDVSAACPARPTWWGGSGALEDAAFGRYDRRSADVDRVASETGALMVWPVGNERLDVGPGWGGAHHHAGSCLDLYDDVHLSEATLQFDTIGPHAVAKNAITVGAARDFPDPAEPQRIVALDSSGFGPTDDGRIKPDLVAVADRVRSASVSADDATAILRGSSSAAAAVTGVVALLDELARRELGRDLDADEMKALLVHTAREAGDAPGPDVRTGWGLVDARAAAELLASEGIAAADARRIRAGVLADGETLVLDTAIVEAGVPLRVALVWTDPPGAGGVRAPDDATPVLVNDLDLALVSPDAVRHDPWTLDVAVPDAPATRVAPNHVDNVEIVDVDAADNGSPGRWQVRIEAPALLRGRPQRFALVASEPLAPAAGAVLGLPRQVLLTASGGEVTQSYSVGVRSLGAAPVEWAARATVPWLEVAPERGTGDADLVFAVDPSVAQTPLEQVGAVVVESDDPSGARRIGVVLRGECADACVNRSCGLDPICGVTCGRCDDGACVEGRCDASGTACPLAELDPVLGAGLAAGSNAGASDRDAGSCGGDGGRERAFAWTAPEAGRYVLTTRGSGYDTVLYVRDGDCNGAELACNDDAGGTASSVSLALEEGQRVVAFVDAFDAGASGEFDLGVARVPCADVDLAERLGQVLVRATTLGAADAHAASCGGEGSGDYAFTWRAPADGRYAFSLRNTHFDVRLYLLEGECGAEIVCADRASGLRLERTLSAGDALTIVIDGRAGANGPFELDVTSLEASCAGACDEVPAVGACGCDEACVALGDCCDDACSTCGACPCAGDCDGRGCGGDGCGGSCGSCPPGERCDDGACVDDPCAAVACGACERCVEGACEPAGDGAPCEDGDLCTVLDACDGDVCRGEPKDCGDGIGCTRDRCEPDTGECVSTPANPCCEDALACTGDDCVGRVEDCGIVGLADAGGEDDASVDGGSGSGGSGGGGCGCRLGAHRVPGVVVTDAAWLGLLLVLARVRRRGTRTCRERAPSLYRQDGRR